MSALQLSNVHFTFKQGGKGVKGIDLTIEEGEFVVIAGKNGSGKTTLCRLLTGLITPDRGEINIFDQPLRQNIQEIRKQLGFVFQNPDTQIVGDTVYNDIAFGPENYRLPHQEIQNQVAASLQSFNLAHLEHHNPSMLSGGEKKRLAIASVLVLNPDLIIFDEPFSNLDYPSTRQVLSIISNLQNTGKTVLIVTHELEKVIAIADRLVVMEDGKIVENGSPESILNRVEAYGVREPCFSKFNVPPISWLQ